jgi:1,4-dihydroxy-2-naphthoate octaprenyltransferase
MLYIFVVIIIIALISKGRELVNNKIKLYLFLAFGLVALCLGIYYTGNPYGNSVVESYTLSYRIEEGRSCL